MCWTCQVRDCFEIWAKKSLKKSGSKGGQKGGQNLGCLRGVRVGSLGAIRKAGTSMNGSRR